MSKMIGHRKYGCECCCAYHQGSGKAIKRIAKKLVKAKEKRQWKAEG